MRKILHGITALTCVLLFATFATAMQSSNPDFNSDTSPGISGLALDYEQMERIRVELLERGFNPGFDQGFDLVADTASIAQFMEAIAQFQSEYDLPVTGQIDALTMAGLSVPIQKSIPDGLPQRAKPSK